MIMDWGNAYPYDNSPYEEYVRKFLKEVSIILENPGVTTDLNVRLDAACLPPDGY